MQTPDSADAVTLAHLTDPHLLADPDTTLLGVDTTRNLQGVLDHMRSHSRHPALLLATGDLTQDGSPQAYARFLSMAAALQLPVHALPGNHDIREPFHTALGERAAPVVNLQHWRIVMLDSTIPGKNGGRLDAGQLALLDTLAGEDDPRHVLLAMHHNPVPLHNDWPDTMIMENADALFERLRRYAQVRALVWGHVHQAYDATLPLSQGTKGRALRMLATPATCFQFGPGSQDFSQEAAAPGYRWITLHANGNISTEVVRVPGLIQTPGS